MAAPITFAIRDTLRMVVTAFVFNVGGFQLSLINQCGHFSLRFEFSRAKKKTDYFSRVAKKY
jgi:hypothetical protein